MSGGGTPVGTAAADRQMRKESMSGTAFLLSVRHGRTGVRWAEVYVGEKGLRRAGQRI
jgi:hypothetical protein